MRRVTISLLLSSVFSLSLLAQMPAAKPVEGQAAASAAKATTIYLVRHAEKTGPSGDVELSDAGKKRAECLARTLSDAGLAAIYTTEFKRTQATAEPAASKSGVTPTVVPGADTKQLVAALIKESGKNVLVVGHSNTIPMIIEALGAGKVTIKDEEYDHLYIVTLVNGQASLASLRYCD